MKVAEIFPIEVDLLRTTINYDTRDQFNDEDEDEDEDDEEEGNEMDAVVEAEEDLISPAS